MRRMPCLLLMMLALSVAHADVIYVDASAKGSGTGTTWDDAYTNLHVALANATAGDQVWVAGGRYVAATEKGPAPFLVPAEVRLLGGFVGDEATFGERPQPLATTILTADVNGDDGPDFTNRTDNGAEVVAIPNLGKGTLLDGFEITGAEKTAPVSLGAGIRANNGSLFLRHCRIHANRNLTNTARGAGLGLRNGLLVMDNCVFENNHVSSSTRLVSGGGGVFAEDTYVLATDCAFLRNHITTTNSEYGGGGLLLDQTDDFVTELTLRRCQFMENHALGPSARGGGLAVGLPVGGIDLLIEDCVFDRNQARYGGAMFWDRRLLDFPESGMVDVRVHRTRVTNNSAEWVAGVGMFAQGFTGGRINTIEIDGCLFEGNRTASEDFALLEGSAGAFLAANEITVRNTQFLRNVVDNDSAPPSAGAAFFPVFTLAVENCAFLGNQIFRNGGVNRLEAAAAAFKVEGTGVANVRFSNTVIAGNRSNAAPAGSVELCSLVEFEGVTIAGNRSLNGGGGLLCEVPMVMRNSVIGGNRTGPIVAPEVGLQLNGPRSAFQLYDCVLERMGSLGVAERTIEADPKFADILGPDGIIATGDESVSLQPDSPCIDRGNNDWLRPDVDDLDNDGDTDEPIPFDVSGNPRQVDQRLRPNSGLGESPIVDIGAYEYPIACPGDLDGDQTIGISDLAVLLEAYGLSADEAGPQTDIQPNGRIDLSDLATILTLFGSACD